VSRISECFERLKQKDRAALVPYVMTGDPHPDATVDIMHALVDGGADMIELGMPFSDPVADGPVIQTAGERALAAGQRLKHSLEAAKAFRARDSQTPIILMGYLNPIEIMGTERFVAAAAEAGVDAVLLVDAPPEESIELVPLLRENGLDMIFLVAPTTRAERRKTLAEMASGFIYYVSLKGVTGAGGLDAPAVREQLAEIRPLTTLPLGVGFGIRDAKTAAAVAEFADAVIVGSSLVSHLHEAAGRGENPATAAREFIEPLSRAMGRTRGQQNDQKEAAIQ